MDFNKRYEIKKRYNNNSKTDLTVQKNVPLNQSHKFIPLKNLMRTKNRLVIKHIQKFPILNIFSMSAEISSVGILRVLVRAKRSIFRIGIRQHGEHPI